MKIFDKLLAAEQMSPIIDRARLHQRMARIAANGVPQFGPDLDSASGDFKLPDSFEIPAEYRLVKLNREHPGYVLPVLATGLWLLPERC